MVFNYLTKIRTAFFSLRRKVENLNLNKQTQIIFSQIGLLKGSLQGLLFLQSGGHCICLSMTVEAWSS